ncbi:hypothetical protein Hypma_009543 [Hypsizygus marmoreus]|uniref:Transposase domain-containing protein n=1 Tax=Hypsizygus marmoreus TaxID=39966 RepID=A0A369JLX8_HYPMA|nr:hypothetical protein Hypma_009543 [Hypsizygus marmoreus]
MPPTKVWCTLCKKMEPRKTEFRHRNGLAAPRVRAVQASHNPFSFIPTSTHQPEPAIAHSLPSASANATDNHSSYEPIITTHGSVQMDSATDADIYPGVGDDLPEGEDVFPDDDNNNVGESNADGEAYGAAAEEAQRRTWANRTRLGTATVDEYESDSDNEDDGDGDETLLDADFDEDDTDDEDGGLPTSDMTNEEFERELAQIADEMTDEDFSLLRSFALKTDEHLTNKTFEKLRFAFPNAGVDTWKTTKARVEFLSALRPVPYDCCTNSCCCYVGPHVDATSCPFCKEPRLDAQGKPRKRFIYIPIIRRLIEYFKNPGMIEKLSYRAQFSEDPGVVKDVFDGSHYRSLKNSNVTVNGRPCSYKHFSDDRDIALGLSTDGFAPFRKRKHTAWPLLVFDYNLPPEIRFHLQYIMCIGIIPGPKKPKDFDSFLWPFVEELLKLSLGVTAFDVASATLFVLHAFLILVFGDMPAVAMVMRMKGHNGISPCRSCHIKGLRVPNMRGTTHYVPLDRSRHPNRGNIPKYDPLHLPHRTHAEFMAQAHEVQFAATTAESEKLATAYGVKGIPLLSCLSSISFPQSFPCDFMHLIYENLVKNLVLLWTGNFKDLDEGAGKYQLNPTAWEAIGAATAASGSTIPSAFGARPPNVAEDKTACTAETWSFWALYLGPVLLHNRFRRPIYYNHFIDIVKILRSCIEFELPREKIPELRTGIAKWVEEYERSVNIVPYMLVFSS